MAEAAEKPKHDEEKFFEMHPMFRKMMMASLGAMAMFHDHMEKVIDRGEELYKNRESRIDEMKEHRKKHMEERRQKLHEHLRGVFDDLGFPNKDDIEELHSKISSLEVKVDSLSKKKE